jgi:hypothetical protein
MMHHSCTNGGNYYKACYRKLHLGAVTHIVETNTLVYCLSIYCIQDKARVSSHNTQKTVFKATLHNLGAYDFKMLKVGQVFSSYA